MPDRDFFGFCTSLRLLELKALGELSEVQHHPAGKVIYHAGDPADALYIVSRGVLTVGQESDDGMADGTYLSRGDIFGDLEVLTDRARQQMARTCEPASVQCIQRTALPELLRRVPSFFVYLSGHLATRLLQNGNAAKSHCLDLTGNLANFDLVTIYQTIAHSSQTGVLSILSYERQSIGEFGFEAGQLRGARFKHLHGEEAFAQLFLTESLTGTFSFSAGKKMEGEKTRLASTGRNPNEMLIAALQGRDELQALRSKISDRNGRLIRKTSRLEMNQIAVASRPLVERVWRLVTSRPAPLCELYEQLPFCEVRFYQAVDELIRTGHFALPVAGTESTETSPQAMPPDG